MARGVEATPTPDVLTWARTSAGLSLEVSAKRAGVEVGRLEQWERGEARPTVAQLRALAAAYRRPLAIFYLPEPPKTFSAMHDYRRLPEGASGAGQSPALRLQIRKAWDRRDIAMEVLSSLHEKPPAFPTATLPKDPDAAAGILRGLLGVREQAQHSWRTEYDAWAGWRSAVEALGTLIFQARDVPIEEARGFSIAEFPLPVIVTNLKDTPRGRVFTLLHEFVHVMRRQSGVCDLDERGRPRNADAQAEIFCNQVAAAILMPREAFLADPVIQAHRPQQLSWNPDTELVELVRNWGGASQEAVLRRLVVLDRASPQFYEQRRQELLLMYRKRQTDQAKDGGFVPPHKLALLSAGSYFTSVVLDGYDRRQLTASDVADFLEIRLKHLPEARGDLSRRAG